MKQNSQTRKKISDYIFSFSDCIGKGNFSTVYKAYHQITNEVFAIKIVERSSLKSQILEQLLYSEIDILKKLNHPNVLKCHEVLISNKHCYIITEFCNEGDLEVKLRKSHTFTEKEAQPFIRDIFLGMLYLQQMKIVHRDIKVANIFLNNGRAKIADFGFAKLTTEKWKDANIGSPLYMSPEGLIDNIYGPKTDVWAFGLLLYELLHGHTPFVHCITELQLVNTIVIPLNWNNFKPDLSPQIKEVILKCLEVNVDNRLGFNELQFFPYFRKLLGETIKKQIQIKDIFRPNHISQCVTPNRQRMSLTSNRIDMFSPLNNRLSQQIFKQLSPTYAQRVSLERVNSENSSFFKSTKSTPTSNLISRQNSIQFKQNVLNNTQILFKQCVNLLNYCRLIYRFLSECIKISYDKDMIVNRLTGFLLRILEEIKRHIDYKKINYGQQNPELKQGKLREVTLEYIRKYKSQLKTNNLMIEQPLSSLFQTLKNIYSDIDSKIDEGNSFIVLVPYFYNNAQNIVILVLLDPIRKYNQHSIKSKKGQIKKHILFIGKDQIIEIRVNNVKNGLIIQQV